MAWLLGRGALLAQLLLLSKFIAGIVGFEADVIPGAYIVEFADDLDDHENAFFSELSTANVLAKPRLSFSSSVFKGVSFHLDDTHDIHDERKKVERIASSKSVKKVFPMRKYSLPYEEVSTAGGYKVHPLPKRQIQERAAGDENTYSLHTMTGVDKLREEGFTGSGIKIAIVDTGIDYFHPDLGGCFGAGCKVGFGYDLVGDAYTGENEPMPDPDPYDNCGGHGTHVAGIIAASSDEQDYFTGVAPNVTLGAYRVMGCAGGVSDDVLIQAFAMAYESGADIITSSIGGSGGWSEEPLNVVVSRIVKAGVPCTISAGNSGAMGPFSSSTPAGGFGTTAVGSVDNEAYPMLLVPGTYFITGSIDATFGWAPGVLSNISEGIYQLYALSYNISSEDDGCHEFPEEPSDLSEYIVLIRRGGCSFSQKAGNAAARGAKHILFYNTEPGTSTVYVYAPGIKSAGMVPETQGNEWISLLAAGHKIHLSILPPEYAGMVIMEEPNRITGGYTSTYSSWGPSYEVRSKPQISAPGGLIASTYPLDLGGYAVLSGTSMSCPFAAGAIALILEARGKLDPATINNLLSSTAKPAFFHDGRAEYPYLAPVPQQGAGLINVHDAVHATSLLDINSISFNDTEHLITNTGFTIKNTGPTAVTYEIDYTPAVTFYTLTRSGARSHFLPGNPPDLLPRSANLSFSITEVTIQPGEKAFIHVSPDLPKNLTTDRIPVYSGYITINTTNGEPESLSLPYLGVDSALRDAPVLNKQHVFLTSTSRPGVPWPPHYQFNIPPPNSTRAKYPNLLAPAVYVELKMGTPLLCVDVQPVNVFPHNYTDIAKTHSKRVFKYDTTKVLGQEILGSIDGFPASYVPGTPVAGAWHGKLSDGSYAPAGNYTFLVSALKIFGDPTKEEDYERVRTDVFGIWYG